MFLVLWAVVLCPKNTSFSFSLENGFDWPECNIKIIVDLRLCHYIQSIYLYVCSFLCSCSLQFAHFIQNNHHKLLLYICETIFTCLLQRVRRFITDTHNTPYTNAYTHTLSLSHWWFCHRHKRSARVILTDHLFVAVSFCYYIYYIYIVPSIHIYIVVFYS